MIGRVEAEVERIAAEMEMGERFPQPEDTRAFIRRYKKYFELEYVDGGIPTCYHRIGAPAFVTIPQSLEGLAHDRALCEEAGHARHTMGMAQIVRYLRPNDPGCGRLARIWKAHDERIARAFLMAWFLPARLIRALRPWEVAEATGFPEELIMERYRDVRQWDNCQAAAQRLDAHFRMEFARGQK